MWPHVRTCRNMLSSADLLDILEAHARNMQCIYCCGWDRGYYWHHLCMYICIVPGFYVPQLPCYMSTLPVVLRGHLDMHALQALPY